MAVWNLVKESIIKSHGKLIKILRPLSIKTILISVIKSSKMFRLLDNNHLTC